MTKRNWLKLMGAGVMLALAFGTGGCSTQAVSTVIPSEPEVVSHSIKVYESPT